MAEESSKHPKNPKTTPHKEKPEVYVLRDWKEYLGESFLIIFSVLLALVLTEYINKLKEKKETGELLKTIKEELVENRDNEKLEYAYETRVMKNIDSALRSTDLQQKIFKGDEFHLGLIAPDGVKFRDLSSVAWDVARSKDITSKADLELVKKLTDIYAQQARIDKLEDKIADVLLKYESRKPENIHTTLVLMRDNYKGWAYDRAPGLIASYDEAIKMLDEIK